MVISITLLIKIFIKVFITFWVEMFLAMASLWPNNDKPTSKTQWVIFFVLSVMFIGFICNIESIFQSIIFVK